MKTRVAVRTAQALGVFGIAVLTALANSMSAEFNAGHGVSLLFPAAAIAVLAGMFFRWWGVAAVFAGYLVSPWGPATIGLEQTFFFALTGALEAAIPAAVRFQETGPTVNRVLRTVLYGAIFNTLVSGVAGVIGIWTWAAIPLTSQQIAMSFVTWVLGDMMAIFLVAFPTILLLKPGVLLDDDARLCFRKWVTGWRAFLPFIVLIAADIAAMDILVPRAGINIHWLGAFLVGPVLAGAVFGGVGGGLLAAGISGLAYVAEVVHLLLPAGRAAVFQAIMTTYVTLAIFIVAGIVAGIFSGRNRVLLHELDEHRRLLQKNFESVVTALAAAIEAKDKTTEGHVQRVARLASRVGRRLGIEGPRLEILRYAAILHDIGKIGVPELILNKRGPLTHDERKVMESHVTIGVEILETVDLLRPAIPSIRYHQERWDGRTDMEYPGYFGLQGEEIPLEARIIAVVDAFDAMTNDRPYRNAMTIAGAIAELRREAGHQFDPAVVGTLLALLENEKDEDISDRWPVLGGRTEGWIASSG
ncbi:MAG: HD domain-containing protein [Acidobacteria bacterium]|nr:HD domain-containing protein [Acidobacteriota bacterium]